MIAGHKAALNVAKASTRRAVAAVVPQGAKTPRAFALAHPVSHANANKFIMISAPTMTPRRPIVTCAAAMAEEQDQQQQDGAPSSSIFITNLPWSVGDGELADHLNSAVGGCTSARVMMSNGRSRGFAIADFESPAAAESAVGALNETELSGRTLGVRIATPRGERPAYGERRERGERGGYERRDRGERGGYERRERSSYNDRGDRGGNYGERRERREGQAPRREFDPDTTLYVGNLSYDTTWQGVRDAFADAGHPAEYANVKTNPDGRSRGFAIVRLGSAESAAAAIDALNNAEIDGRRINVRLFNTERPPQRE